MTFEIVENKNKEETHLHTKKIWLAGDANVISRSSVDQKGDLKAKAMNVAAKAKIAQYIKNDVAVSFKKSMQL